MEITAFLKSFIYLIASSLFLPVLLILCCLILWLVVYAGSFFSMWLERQRLPRDIGDLPLRVKAGESVTLFPSSVRLFQEKLGDLQHEIEVINLLRTSELELWKTLDGLKILIRVGPGLGLIGTLIPMGTGLASLGQGDLTSLSGDLVVAFTTTVVGMTLGLVSYLFFTMQRRWVEEDVKNMELIAEVAARRDNRQ